MTKHDSKPPKSHRRWAQLLITSYRVGIPQGKRSVGVFVSYVMWPKFGLV